jgi:ribosome biogenesis GTPase
MALPPSGVDGVKPGVVVAAYGRRYRVELADHTEVDCVTRGRRTDVACGDHVHAVRTGAGTGVIDEILPRRSLFYRSDARRQKLIAANVTQVVIVVAAEPAYSEDLINRCLAAAEHAGILALIALNKVDLPGADAASAALELYRSLGYRVVGLSAKRDLEPLRRYLSGHTSVLVGQSGMGKSTIINGLIPDACARVAEISTALGTGRHTTTHAELYHLGENTHIIDSPGLQEFGLGHVPLLDLADAFVEFRPLLGSCRFRDCVHLSEPDCAIAAACEDGRVSERRLASYRRLAGELRRERFR